MTQEDMTKLWELLKCCRRGDKAANDKRVKAAWLLVLEPYDYQDVKTAVIAHFRESKFFPDVGEITQRLPPLPTTQKPASPQNSARIAREVARLRKMREAKP